ncbi:hypothetical protein HK104_008234, partial [Borealophlyctis nickersoniae]
ALSVTITDADLVWGEAGWRRFQSEQNCWNWAAKEGHVHVVAWCLDTAGMNVHAKDDCALRCAARRGRWEVVRLLLAKGANVHARDDEALRNAVSSGHLEVVRLLLESGANVHHQDDTALRDAALKGHLEIVRLLLDRGANVHAKYGDALFKAATRGRIEVARLLLDRGADVRTLDEWNLCIAADEADDHARPEAGFLKRLASAASFGDFEDLERLLRGEGCGFW